MNKKTVSTLAVYVIVFILFNVIALVVPFKSGASRWIEYAFTDIAIILSAVITWVAFSKGDNLKSKFYGFPVFRVGIIYVVAQFIVWLIISCVCILVAVPAWVSIVLSAIILCLALIGVIATDSVRDVVIEQEEKIAEETKTIKYFSLEVTSLISACKDTNLKKAVERLAEKVKYSDPVSSEATAEIEKQIQDEVSILASLIRTDYSAAMEKVDEVAAIVDERNRVCRESK